MFQSNGLSLLALVSAAALIAFFGVRLSALADRFADRTGLGEAVIGALVLGGLTSLPGITATVSLALDERAALAVSSALGGIAAQTMFLALADLAYRRANLEHAAASLPNIIFGALLITLLSLLLLAFDTPELRIGHLHPVSLALPIAYIGGLRWVGQARDRPMWQPRMTHQTRTDAPSSAALNEHLGALTCKLLATASIVGFGGWLVGQTAPSLAQTWGFSESLMGATVVAIITSLPELVTSLAAVRQGALTLAVGGILGGNAFDTLFVAVADLAYLPGPITAATTANEGQLAAVSAIMTGVVLMGLIHRERQGPANVGIETILIAAVYAAAIALVSQG